MSDPPLTEKLVYLALKDIFVGNEIQPVITRSIRKWVRKRINKFQNDFRIKALIQQHTLPRITQVATVLLEEQIFDSDSKAKARFPDVFEVLPSHDDQPTYFEPKIAKSDAAPVQRIGVYSPEELLSIGASLKPKNEEQQINANLPAYIPKIATNEVADLKIVDENGLEAVESGLQNTDAVSESSQQPHTQPTMATQSLDSVCLPLWDQHRILARVQYILEKACFTFAQKHLGGVLQREGWDCTEAVELNRWPKVLLTYQEECGLNNIKNLRKPLPILLNSITQLRHDTVHRTRLSSTRILQHLTDAVLLARLLHDDVCADSICLIWKMTRDTIEEMIRSKQLLDCRLAEIKKEFATKRAALERQESRLLEAVVREHKEPMVSVSGSLDRLLSGDLGDSNEVHARWGHVHDSTLSSNESSEPRSTAESKKGQELGDKTAEQSDGSVKSVEHLSASPILVPTVDGGFIELALTCGKKDAGKHKDEDLSEPLPHPARTNPELDSHESDPENSSQYSLPHHPNVSTTTKNVAEEAEEEIEAAAAVMSDWDGSNQ